MGRKLFIPNINEGMSDVHSVNGVHSLYVDKRSHIQDSISMMPFVWNVRTDKTDLYWKNGVPHLDGILAIKLWRKLLGSYKLQYQNLSGVYGDSHIQ